MIRSSDFESKEEPLDRLFDEAVQMIMEASRDWRRLDLRRPGDDRKVARAA